MWLKTILPVVLLTGCTSVVPATLARLNNFSPLTVDPAALQAAVTVPDGVSVPVGGATMLLEATRSDTNETLSQTFVLDQTETGDLLVFEVADEDIAAFRTLQRKVRTWEEIAKDETTGSFGVDVTLCKVGDGPAEDATFSVFVQADDGGLMPILRDAPVSEVIGSGAFDGEGCA
ncbi:MAG: hypothetical protein ABJF50_22350 [Paracoccaceae bacterium]